MIPALEKKLQSAYWLTNKTGIVALHQDYPFIPQELHVKEASGTSLFKSFDKLNTLFFGKQSGYFSKNDKLYFLLSKDLYPHLEIEDNNYYVVGTFNGWQSAIGDEKWKLQFEYIEDERCLCLSLPLSELNQQAEYAFKFVDGSNNWLQVPYWVKNKSIDSYGHTNFSLKTHITGNHLLKFSLLNDGSVFEDNFVVWKEDYNEEWLKVDYRNYLLSLKSEKPLGVFLSEHSTTFRLFCPRAKRIVVNVYSKLEYPAPQLFELNPNLDGSWEIEIFENFEHSYYYYTVEGRARDEFSNFDATVKLVDPYALAVVSPQGPGIIVDKNKIEISKDEFQPPAWHNLIILEAHIQDLVTNLPINSNSQENKGFRELNDWLYRKDCYLKDLGINAVELLPVQEFELQGDETYNWGYMPVNYFAPASWYSVMPQKASQIKEFQSLVNAFHQSGIAVILDVVYNHLGNTNSLLYLDKYYYFQVNDAGHLMNYSGCGNDFRADAPMTTRLIIDSLEYWIKIYNVDGFRFDLAELIGVEVLREVETELKKIKPSIILIAEPWSFRGHIAYALKETGFSSWNDGYRDFITKYILGQGNHEGVCYFLSGSLSHLSRFPAQTVNYPASHDDHCWIDKITENPNHNGEIITNNDRRRTHLMIALVCVSIGIPMFPEGIEIFHSKKGNPNTYSRGDLNYLKYENIPNFSNTHAYFRSWVHFRLSEKGKSLRTDCIHIQSYLKFFYSYETSAIGVLFNAAKQVATQRLLFVINPHLWKTFVPIEPNDLERSQFAQVADHERFDVNGLKGAYLLWENGRIELPPLSCGLWLEL